MTQNRMEQPSNWLKSDNLKFVRPFLCSIFYLKSLRNLQANGDEEEAPVGKSNIQSSCQGWVRGTEWRTFRGHLVINYVLVSLCGTFVNKKVVYLE